MEHLFVLGHPVAHSKSPAMHAAAYQALGLNWEYGLVDCESEAEARALLSGGDWRACNITMPYKPLAYELADVRSKAAELAQGANVLVNWNGRLHADNTDGAGCVSYLKRCGVKFEDASVVVCGTGPTSLAIMHACVEAGVACISLLGRDAAKAQRALDGYRALAQGSCDDEALRLQATSYGAASREISDANVIVDATPLGMRAGDPAPFDTQLLSQGQVVFDVVYGHGETALLAAARAAGCAAFDGSGMLVAQAVETVVDISTITGLFAIPADVDLFRVMAEAAGFDI